jgi:uncharacterized protein DUF541
MCGYRKIRSVALLTAMRNTILMLLAVSSVAWGDLEPNTVTIAASRTLNIQPDEVIFSVDVVSGPGTSFEQILLPLAGTGITEANFGGVEPYFGVLSASEPARWQWSFTISEPFNKMKATIDAFTKLQQSIGNNNTGLSLIFSIRGLRTSDKAQQAQACPLADLVADARRQAQKLVDAAGLTLGPIETLSDGMSPTVAYQSPSILSRSSTVGNLTLGILSFVSTPQYCSLVIQFQILRYQ